MAYIKTDWEDGDVISEPRLDHLETGVYNNSVAIGDLSELDTTAKANLVAAINEAAQSGGGGGGISNAVKDALLQIASKVAYIDEDGQEYYDDLYNALYPGAVLVSIQADYTQTGTVYPTTPLDDLRNDLVVNAIYDNGSVVPVISYTLSGTLEEGTSSITVTYEGETDTFDVTVSAVPTVSSISAVYTQSGTVYDTDSLDSLKADLVVTATYSDSSTATVPSADYTLSGTLTEGTSTITVSYEEKTTTFNVTVSQAAPTPIYDWDFTQSLVDSVDGMTATLRGGATRDENGIQFTAASQCAILTNALTNIADKTVIIDIPSSELVASGSNHTRLFSSTTNADGNTATNAACFVWRYNNGWTVYSGASWGTSWDKTAYPLNFFDSKRLKIYVGEDYKLKVSYAAIGSDSFVEIGTIGTAWQSTYASGYLVLGGFNNNALSVMTISKCAIYGGEV